MPRGCGPAAPSSPPDDPYQMMRVAYPLTFIVMGIEGRHAWPGARGAARYRPDRVRRWPRPSRPGPSRRSASRWSFRVLVPPGEPPVVRGPYAFMRHPNYLAVCGEIIGVALIVGAAVTGVAAFLGFGWLMLRRIAVEDRALGRR